MKTRSKIPGYSKRDFVKESKIIRNYSTNCEKQTLKLISRIVENIFAVTFLSMSLASVKIDTPRLPEKQQPDRERTRT